MAYLTVLAFGTWPRKGDGDAHSSRLPERKREQMEFALTSIWTNRNTEEKYIEVWCIFSRAAETLKHDGDPTSQLEVVAGLARHFLGKNVFIDCVRSHIRTGETAVY
ncbi:hypothetical protein LZ30DRAFT_790366 [Colletotrichum cereale]|nr:hypothetical protein LZ30DRAFT_790366 [Colletotrichum cereale]